MPCYANPCYAKQRIDAKIGVRFHQLTKVYYIFITIRNTLLKKLVINLKYYILMWCMLVVKEAIDFLSETLSVAILMQWTNFRVQMVNTPLKWTRNKLQILIFLHARFLEWKISNNCVRTSKISLCTVWCRYRNLPNSWTVYYLNAYSCRKSTVLHGGYLYFI